MTETTVCHLTIAVRNPADGRVVGEVLNETPEAVAAMARELRLFQPEWEALGPKGRKPWLLKFRDWVLDNVERIADVVQSESGKTRAAGERGNELESSARAHWLAGQFGLRSPAIDAAAQPLPITDREREIAAMVAAGLSNREIADRLCVSVRTVDGHLYRIFAKLDIENRDQLARLVSVARSGSCSGGPEQLVARDTRTVAISEQVL